MVTPTQTEAGAKAAAVGDVGSDGAAEGALGPAEVTAEDIGIKENPTATPTTAHTHGTTATEAEVDGKGEAGPGEMPADHGLVKDDDGAGADTGPPPDVAAAVIAAANQVIAVPSPPPAAFALGPTLQFGIPAATVLAPVPLPPKRKRKAQDEFTISQKLQILSELKGPNAISVPDLAAKHNTSRTSVYRWKKDMPRLQKLAKKEGKGAYKRASNVSKRKLYNEEYTAAEKLAVVRKLKGDNAPSVRDLASKLGANHRSLYRWKRDEERLVKLVEQDGKGKCKRVGEDPLHRIKEALKLFHAKHYSDTVTAEGEPGPTGLTGTIIATKARQIRDEMLAQHKKTPFLTNEEVKGMVEFTGSTSWGRKIIYKFGWKESNSYKDGSNTDVDNDGSTMDASKASSSSSKPAAAARSPATRTKQNSKLSLSEQKALKRELSFLKRKLHNSETRAAFLQEENDRLKAQILSMANKRNAESEQILIPVGGVQHLFDISNNAPVDEEGIDEAAASAFVDAIVARERNGGGVGDGDRTADV